MNDEQLASYLASVDEPGDDVPPAFKEQLWLDLQPVLQRQRAEAVVLDDTVASPPRRGPFLGLAVAAILLVAVLVWPRAEEASIEVRVDAPTPTTAVVTTTSVPLSATAACEQFLADSALLPVGLTPQVDLELVLVLEEQVELFGDRLELASDVPASVEQTVRNAGAALREAARHLEADDQAAAESAVGSAQTLVSSIDADLEAVGIDCFLPE